VAPAADHDQLWLLLQRGVSDILEETIGGVPTEDMLVNLDVGDLSASPASCSEITACFSGIR
jgi:hypothetical protein